MRNFLKKPRAPKKKQVSEFRLENAFREMDYIFGDGKVKIVRPVMYYKTAERIIGRELTEAEKVEHTFKTEDK